MAHQIVLTFLPGWGLNRLDSPGAQGHSFIWDHQSVIDADDTAEATTALAGSDGRVEREHGCDRVGVTQIAFRAMQTGGEFPDRGVVDIDRDPSAAVLERHFDRLDHASTLNMGEPKTVCHDVEDQAF